MQHITFVDEPDSPVMITYGEAVELLRQNDKPYPTHANVTWYTGKFVRDRGWSEWLPYWMYRE